MIPKLRCVGVAFVLALGGCGYSPTELEMNTVDEIKNEMKTWAIGRHLVELPQTWRYALGSDVTLYYGLNADFKTVEVRIVSEGVSGEMFKDAVAHRAERISEVTNTQARTSMLIKNSQIDERTSLLEFYRTSELSRSRTHEIHLLLDDIYVLIQADSYDGLIAPVEGRLKEVAAQIDKFTTPERVGAGFVLGPIIIRGRHDHEYGTIKFYDAQRRDVGLELDISAITRDEDVKLMPRMRRDLDGFGVARNALIREREIFLAGMQGEEVLVGLDGRKSVDDEPRRELLFIAESYRANPGFLSPALTFRLTTGGKKTPRGRP